MHERHVSAFIWLLVIFQLVDLGLLYVWSQRGYYEQSQSTTVRVLFPGVSMHSSSGALSSPASVNGMYGNLCPPCYADEMKEICSHSTSILLTVNSQ